MGRVAHAGDDLEPFELLLFGGMYALYVASQSSSLGGAPRGQVLAAAAAVFSVCVGTSLSESGGEFCLRSV